MNSSPNSSKRSVEQVWETEVGGAGDKVEHIVPWMMCLHWPDGPVYKL